VDGWDRGMPVWRRCPLAGNASIWLNEDPRYNAMGATYPGYLPAADAARLERIRQARMLFDGRHREFFLGEGRTQFSFPQGAHQ
jgi:hypothetical protein